MVSPKMGLSVGYYLLCGSVNVVCMHVDEIKNWEAVKLVLVLIYFYI